MLHRHMLSACVACLALALPGQASAGTILVSMSPSSQDVEQGGTGYVLEFSMTTASAIDLGGFNVTVTAPNASGIIFTGGDAAVANYVFASDLSGLFTFSNPVGASSGDINDFPNSFNLNLAAGTYSLGRMFFDVAPNAAPGNVDIVLEGATSFTEGVLPFGTYSYMPVGGSTIGTVNVLAVPEPSSLLMGGISAAAGAWAWLQKRRKTRRNA